MGTTKRPPEGVSGMSQTLKSRLAKLLFVSFCFCSFLATASAQNKVMGEVRFEGATKLEKDSGVWVDGGYVGYLKELKGSKKVLLLPGEHTIAVRQDGYQDFTQRVMVEPGQKQVVSVLMQKAL